MAFSDGLGNTDSTPRFITLEVSSLSHIIITALNGLQDTQLGHQTGRVIEALIENAVDTTHGVNYTEEEVKKVAKEITWYEAVEQWRKYRQLVQTLNPRKV